MRLRDTVIHQMPYSFQVGSGETRIWTHVCLIPEPLLLITAPGNDVSGGPAHSRCSTQRSYYYYWRPGERAGQVSACLRVWPTSWERADPRGTKSQGAWQGLRGDLKTANIWSLSSPRYFWGLLMLFISLPSSSYLSFSLHISFPHEVFLEPPT